VLSGDVLQVSLGAIPVLACCLERSVMTGRGSRSSGEGETWLIPVFEKGVWSHGSTARGQQWGLPRGTCLQPAAVKPLVPKEQLFQKLEPM